MARFLGGSFLGPPVIVRLFPRRFFLGPMVVNGMRVPLDITDSKKGKESILKRYVYTTVLHIVFDLYGKESKANVYGNDMFIQLFYTLYLIYMEKKVKQMFMEMISLYNCFAHCI